MREHVSTVFRAVECRSSWKNCHPTTKNASSFPSVSTMCFSRESVCSVLDNIFWLVIDDNYNPFGHFWRTKTTPKTWWIVPREDLQQRRVNSVENFLLHFTASHSIQINDNFTVDCAAALTQPSSKHWHSISSCHVDLRPTHLTFQGRTRQTLLQLCDEIKFRWPLCDITSSFVICEIRDIS